jgi:hypothetical protein
MSTLGKGRENKNKGEESDTQRPQNDEALAEGNISHTRQLIRRGHEPQSLPPRFEDDSEAPRTVRCAVVGRVFALSQHAQSAQSHAFVVSCGSQQHWR